MVMFTQRARAALVTDDNEEDVEDDAEAEEADDDEEEEDDSGDFDDDLTLDDIIGDVSALDKGALGGLKRHTWPPGKWRI